MRIEFMEKMRIEQRASDQQFQASQKKWDRVVQISSTVINVILTAAIGILLVKLGLKDK